MKIEEEWIKRINIYYQFIKEKSNYNEYKAKKFEVNGGTMIVVRSEDKKAMLVSRLNLSERKSRTKCWIDSKKIIDKKDSYEINEKKSLWNKKRPNKNDGSR